MKTLKYILLLSLFVIIQMTSARAQSAGTDQVGLRLGGFSGLDYKHVFNSDVGIHLNLMARYPFGRGMFEGLIEKNFPIEKGFVFVVGAGGFVGTDFVHVYHNDRYRVFYYSPIPGVTGMAGLDYYIPKAPVNIGLDLRPRISVFGLYPWDAAITFRLIL